MRALSIRTHRLLASGLTAALSLGTAAGCNSLAARLMTARPMTGRQVVSTSPVALRVPASEPSAAEPTAEEPVTAVAWVRPGMVAAGGEAEIWVRVRVAAVHYLHPPGVPPFIPASVETAPDGVLRPVGEWQRTTPADAAGHLSGVVEFRQSVRIAPDAAPGPHEVGCRLKFQVCDAELCWPSRVLKLVAPLVVSR